METLLLMIMAHFVADYPLQTPEMGKYKNRRNQPKPPDSKARMVRVWPAYLIAHGMVHGFLVAMVADVWAGLAIAIIHSVQDFIKCEIQYSPNLDQLIHVVVIVMVWLLI